MKHKPLCRRRSKARSTAAWGTLVVLLCVIACAGASKPLSSFLPSHSHSQDGLPLETQVGWMPLNKTEWELLHDTHIARLTSMRPHEHLDLAVFGDSITESLKGTIMGSLHRSSIDHPAVWRHHFGDWLTEVFGIAGDMTGHLLWRMQRMPENINCHSAVILIGTNNFHNHYYELWDASPMSDTLGVAEEIAAGVIACAATLHRRWPATHILIVGILPRANPRDMTWNNPGAHYDLPTLFMEPTKIANQLLARYAEPEKLIDYADCGEGFYLAGSGGKRLDSDLMKDGLHPTAKGMDVLLWCIKQYLALPVPESHHHRQKRMSLTDLSNNSSLV